MDTTIPYHPGLLLGRSVDMRKMTPGFMLIGEEVVPTKLKVNMSTSQFSFATSLKDVCDVLGYPPEYALKVKSHIIENSMVKACLENLDKPDSFTIIFRATFLEQKEYLNPDIVPVYSDHSEEQANSNEECHTTESLLAEAVADSEMSSSFQSQPLTGGLTGKRNSFRGTHWVKATKIGNELVTVMNLSCKDTEKLDNLRIKFGQCLQAYHGELKPKMHALQKMAEKIDKKLSKKHYHDVSLDIWYCSFDKLDKYPAFLVGMVKTIDNFMDHCVGWAERSKHGSECEVEACIMECNPGIDKEEKTHITASLKQMFSNFMNPSSGEQPMASKEKPIKEAETNVDGDGDSFVVFNISNPQYFYPLQVILQSFKEENDVADSCSSNLALSQYPETTNTMFDNLFKLLVSCDKAERLVQEFFSSQRYLLETRVEEGNQVLKSIQNIHLLVHEAVAELDFVCIPQASTLENWISADPLSTVELFIENVTSKLPPGSDIDLLMIGKTGHGKSSTGNSILGQNKFLSSADGESVTSCTGVGWTEIDGRTIKVVDTPGVCDTNLETDASSIDLAIKSISEAITNCPDGFHALLLIVRFGGRMTTEEKKAIGLLKCVLGEDIVRSHCICVVTYGDNFNTEMAEKKSFEMWCRDQGGFLKELFEECNYRCVLFNNKATDPKVKKTQLIKLVSKVDSLKGSGTRYTNHLFEFAQRERKRITSEENLPQVSEEMMRDIQLILQHLNNMVNNTNEAWQYKEELAKLSEKVDNLSNRVSEGGQLECLVETVFSLAATIHSKMDEIADRPIPDSPDENVHGPETDSQCAFDNTATKTISAESSKGQDSNQRLKDDKERLEKVLENEVLPHQSIVDEKVSRKVQQEVKDGNNCFPGSSVVTLVNGKSITLEELQVGDKVLVRNNAGLLCFDTVYMFGHKQFDTSNEFIAMKTSSHTVYATAEHYVYCIKQDKEVCLAAKDVQVGDCLLGLTSDGLIHQTVESIKHERKQGLFAPFTNSGNIIIDGVLMSCYIDVLSHTTCHTLLWPVRQLYRVSPRMLSHINGSSKQYPVPLWTKAALKLI